MNEVVSIEAVTNKIFNIRGINIMLDRDLADLYGVETKVLKQAVRRNIKRFPDDFMFELTKEELQNWRSQFVTSNFETLDQLLITKEKPKRKIGFTYSVI